MPPRPWDRHPEGEAAYFTSTNPQSDNYALWCVAAGASGRRVDAGRRLRRPGDHGASQHLRLLPGSRLRAPVVAHAGYTIDVNRSVAFEAVVRQNGRGVYAKAEYTQAFGQHWRATTGFALIRGDPADFLGQYRRNSHGILTLRYSF